MNDNNNNLWDGLIGLLSYFIFSGLVFRMYPEQFTFFMGAFYGL